jgi:hypothetical protein
MLLDMQLKFAQAWMDLAQAGMKATSEACMLASEQNARSWTRMLAGGESTPTPTPTPRQPAPVSVAPLWPMLELFAPRPLERRTSEGLGTQAWNPFWFMGLAGQQAASFPTWPGFASPAAAPTLAVTLSWPMMLPGCQWPSGDALSRPADPYSSFRSASGYAAASLAAPMNAASPMLTWWNWMTPFATARRT